MAKELGKRQLGVLRGLNDLGEYPTNAWYWQSGRVTAEVLRSLVKRGLVDVRTEEGRGERWTINEAGREALAGAR